MSITRKYSAVALRRLSLATALAAAATFLLAPAPQVYASSHSDAPLIKLDPQANLTDVYAFIRERPTGEKVLVVEVSVRPFSEPGDGAMYEAFSSDARYSIHIANPATGKEAQRYDFRFSPVDTTRGSYKNLGTILRYGRGADINGALDVGPILTVGDEHQNFVQTYDVFKSVGGKRRRINGQTILLVPPPNVGQQTTPLYNDADGRAISGATSRETLDPYTQQTVYDLSHGLTVFAGPREDGFYADIPGIFDLLDGRILDNDGDPDDGLGQDGNGVDGFKGFNVLHYGLVIPVSELPSFPYTGALQPPGTGVGVYASVSRATVTVRSDRGPDRSRGPTIQVNRDANPLFNEALVALADKDNYNRTSPTVDAAQYVTYALNPELALLFNAVFGTAFQTTDRVDLQAIYIPDVIRVNTTTGPVPVSGESGFNRLSFIGGDTVADGDGNQIPAGWPNGRRLGDDVIDIAFTAVASGPSFDPITVVGDNIATNDQVYNQVFPYAATPHAGTRNSKDSGPNVMPPAVPLR
ncbi:MAG: DUF4331 domain-containing protein [Chthoniobacterales bacterium]|nr:DUF4331 domain-containing protein [Chthoniobacterales bacterium]